MQISGIPWKSWIRRLFNKLRQILKIAGLYQKDAVVQIGEE